MSNRPRASDQGADTSERGRGRGAFVLCAGTSWLMAVVALERGRAIVLMLSAVVLLVGLVRATGRRRYRARRPSTRTVTHDPLSHVRYVSFGAGTRR